MEKECLILYFAGMIPIFFWICSYCFERDVKIYKLSVSKGYTRTIIKLTAIFSGLLLLWPLSLLFTTGKYIFGKYVKNVKK